MSKTYVVRIWNQAPKAVPAFQHRLDQALDALKSLHEVQVSYLKNLDNLESSSDIDLLIILASFVDDEIFPKWFEGFQNKLKAQIKHAAPVPLLIITPIGIETLIDTAAQQIKQNEYVDMISPDHISSLPIRVSNLLKIHDHIREIHTYEKIIQGLQEKFDGIEAHLSQIKDAKNS